MAKILSVYNRLQAGDYENGNGGKRRVSRLTQFIHATLQSNNDSFESVLSTNADIINAEVELHLREHGYLST